MSRILVLFDVDGTLTIPRKPATGEVKDFLKKLRSKVTIGMVGGSNLKKQKEQLGENLLNQFDYVFAENGLVAYHNCQLIHSRSISDHLGEEQLQEFINYVLWELSNLHLPFKRGSFIEFRTGMLNICPPGRDVSYDERIKFNEYDQEHHIREILVKKLEPKLKKYGLKASIGGQISFDVFPIGWDKTYCLQHLDLKDFDEVHFFGDKTYEGGNDYEIYSSPLTIGYSVKDPSETLKICQELFL